MISRLFAVFLILFVPALVFAQTPAAPPLDVNDIMAVLDQYKPDPVAVEKLRAEATAEPPATTNERDLTIFYHKRARANRLLGNIRQEIADLKQALSYGWDRPLPQDEGLGDKGYILSELGSAELGGGNTLRGLEAIQTVAQFPSMWGRKMSAWCTISNVQARFGDMQAAREAHNMAKRAFSSSQTSKVYDIFVHNWQKIMARGHGDLLSWEGNHIEAERHFRRGLEESALDYKDNAARLNTRRDTLPQTTAMRSWASAEERLARCLRNQGRLAEAESHARSALFKHLQTSGRYSPPTASAINGLGWIIFEAGRFADAATLARAAIESYEKAGVVPESLSLADARSLLGAALVAQSNWPEALAVFEARDKALSSDPDQYAKVGGRDTNWGLALLRKGEGKKALAMLEDIYRRRRSTGLSDTEYFTAQSRGFYAMALAAQGQGDQALAEFQGVVPVLVEGMQRDAGDQGGTVANQMRLVWIIEAYMNLLVDLRDSPQLKGLGIDAAAETFRLADVARGSSVQRALAESSARMTPSDPALADLIRREQDNQRRFVMLSDLLNRLLSAPAEKQQPEAIADIKRKIETTRTEREKLKPEIRQRFPEYAQLINPKPAELAEVQSALSNDEALLSIYVGAERSYVWAVPKTGPVAFARADLTDAQVTASVNRLRQALDVKDVPLTQARFDLPLSHELYRKLLLPVVTGWQQAKSLIVVPHKTLGQLPFAVLTTAPYTPTAKGKHFEEYRQAPWLIRRMTVSQLPSVSALLALRRVPPTKAGRKEFIGFGDPIFSKEMALVPTGATRGAQLRNLNVAKTATLFAVEANAPNALPSISVANSAGLSQLARLPDTAEEIESIAKVLHADPATDVFLGKAASEKNVKSGQLLNRRIVMFATHGLVPGNLSGLTVPALALSAPEVTGNVDEDGLLTMEEVLGLKLNADWVVLSACNTAAGDGAGSEAVSGLGKAFFYAGARSLLVSNWPVETVSARLLTTKLFEFQATNPTTSRAEALRTTMLDLMDRAVPADTLGGKAYTYAHPIFWAPFSLVGDGER